MLELADLGRTIMGLGVVLALMAAVFWLLRRFAPQGTVMRGGPGRRLALIESMPLDPRTRLVLVRHDGNEHLIVVSSAGSASLLQSKATSDAVAGRGEAP